MKRPGPTGGAHCATLRSRRVPLHSLAASKPLDVSLEFLPRARFDLVELRSHFSAEHEAVAAYGVGAGSGLLKGGVLALATTFQGHHKQHVDVLAGTVRKLGGHPADAKAKYTFPVETLKTQNDVLRFAAGLEKGAVSAYVAAVPLFKDRELSKAAASILGDEAMHWAVLRQALGEEPVPAAFVS